MATFTFRQRGFRQEPAGEQVLVNAFSNAAVTNGQNLVMAPIPFNAYIVGVYAHAGAAGSGTGSTTIALTALDGGGNTRNIVTNTSIGIAAADTGFFTAALFQSNEIRAGEVLRVYVSGIPTTTGHGQVGVSVILVPR